MFLFHVDLGAISLQDLNIGTTAGLARTANLATAMQIRYERTCMMSGRLMQHLKLSLQLSRVRLHRGQKWVGLVFTWKVEVLINLVLFMVLNSTLHNDNCTQIPVTQTVHKSQTKKKTAKISCTLNLIVCICCELTMLQCHS